VADLGDYLPAEPLDSIRVVFDLHYVCTNFPMGPCPPEQNVSNQSPYWDNVRVGLVSGIVSVEPGPQSAPAAATVSVVPNPARRTVDVAYRLPSSGVPMVFIYNVAGARVRTLLQGKRQAPGEYRLPWDGRDDTGHLVGSGIYFLRLRTAGAIDTHRLVLTR
jgi:hypothetical protein